MNYPTERSRLIASGRILPLDARPTLRLLPSERELFEAAAIRGDMHYRGVAFDGGLVVEYFHPGQEVNEEHNI